MALQTTRYLLFEPSKGIEPLHLSPLASRLSHFALRISHFSPRARSHAHDARQCARRTRRASRRIDRVPAGSRLAARGSAASAAPPSLHGPARLLRRSPLPRDCLSRRVS
ncbi:hypothetical protein X977_5230 [Burkholderia pseudomallei MSHR7504]|nr:hypothetical protein X977_5230 [Burkholderia pseudomallei MSHR7504]